jgi:hypothetical protein
VPRTKVDFDTAVEPAAAVSSVVNAIVDAVCSDAATYTAEQQLRTGIHSLENRKSSRYRGVSRRPGSSSWVISVSQKGRTRYLGEFDSEEDAARAYDDFRRKKYGVSAHGGKVIAGSREISRLNFPTDEEKRQFCSWALFG